MLDVDLMLRSEPRHSLETYIKEFRTLIDEELTDAKENSPIGDIIDYALFDGRELFACEAMAQVLGCDSGDEHRAVVRGILFGRQVSGCVYGQNAPGVLPNIDVSDSVIDLRDKLKEEAGQYLGARPATDALIGYYIEDIAPFSKFHHRAEEAVATMMLVAERGDIQRTTTRSLDAEIAKILDL